MPVHQYLELMLGSPVVDANAGTAFSATITANEDGVAKLSKLQCSLRGDKAAATVSFRTWQLAQVRAITLNGADLYIRGSNTPGAPMGQWGPDRRGIIAGLPDVALSSRDTILITGVSTCTCCESTARDGMMLNFRTMMVSDGCAAPDDYLHNATLNNFYLQFGDVQGTDDIVALLDAPAKAAAAE